MERTTRNLDKTSTLVSSPALRSGNIQDIRDDLELYWDAYKLHMTSLFTFWNVEHLLSTMLTDLLKKAGEEEVKQGLARFFKPSETNHFVLERQQLQKIARRSMSSSKTTGLSGVSPELRAALEEHSRFFGFLMVPFNLGALPSVESLLERVNEAMTDKTTRETRMLPQETFKAFPEEIREIGKLAQQLAFWKTERLDILSLADARVQNLYQTAAKVLRLPLDQFFAMTANEILESLKTGFVVVGEQIRKERQHAWCLLLYKGSIHFCAPTKAQENINVTQSDVSFLQGVVASTGKVEGVVRVIKSDDDLKALKTGEILVAIMTRPEFGPALDRAAAFVTDEGGMLSHAAIVSREMNKPCIIGTKSATQVLKDGDLVEVDADNGVVRVIERAGE